MNTRRLTCHNIEKSGIVGHLDLPGAVVAPQQGVTGHLPCQKCCRPGSQSVNNKNIYQV